jgi:hypothetical protein
MDMGFGEQASLALTPLAYQFSERYRVRLTLALLMSSCPVYGRQPVNPRGSRIVIGSTW